MANLDTHDIKLWYIYKALFSQTYSTRNIGTSLSLSIFWYIKYSVALPGLALPLLRPHVGTWPCLGLFHFWCFGWLNFMFFCHKPEVRSSDLYFFHLILIFQASSKTMDENNHKILRSFFSNWFRYVGTPSYSTWLQFAA